MRSMPEPPRIEVDLYAILNVTHDATAAQIRSAYRKQSQVYHPDKHRDPASKTAAEERFTRVKHAYEILIDDKLRAIYDEFGYDNAREAAEPVNENVPLEDLVALFREDKRELQPYSRFGPDHEENQSGTRRYAGGPPPRRERDAHFTITNHLTSTVDGTGLTAALEDYDGGYPLLVVSKISVNSTATAYVTQKVTCLAEYNTTSVGLDREKSAGIGTLTLGGRYHIDQYANAELSTRFNIEHPTNALLTFQASRQISKAMTLTYKHVCDSNFVEATSVLALARSFDERHHAVVSLSTGTYPNYSFEWHRFPGETDELARDSDDEDDDGDEIDLSTLTIHQRRVRNLSRKFRYLVQPCGVKIAFTYSGIIQGGITVRRKVGPAYPLFHAPEDTQDTRGVPSVQTSLQAGVFGWELKVGGGMTHVLSDTKWGIAVSCGTQGVTWCFDFQRSGHRFILPIVLVSNNADAKAASVAALTTSFLAAAVQSFIVKPILDMADAKARAQAREQRMETLQELQRKAKDDVALSVNHVRTIRRHERGVEIDGVKEAGLLIERAVYGIRDVVKKVRLTDPSFEGSEIEKEVIEVGECVQALVENSSVQVVSSTKCTLNGFWDPSATGDRDQLVLKVWYKFKAHPHECVVKDMQPLELPLSNHRVPSWS